MALDRFEDRAQQRASDLGGLGMASGRAVEQLEGVELAAVIVAAADGEFDVETLGVALRGALAKILEADVAGADLHDQLDQRAGWNHVEALSFCWRYRVRVALGVMCFLLLAAC